MATPSENDDIEEYFEDKPVELQLQIIAAAHRPFLPLDVVNSILDVMQYLEENKKDSTDQ